MGEVPRLEEELRAMEGETEPVFTVDVRDAVGERACKPAEDLRRSSLSELELGMRLGAVC